MAASLPLRFGITRLELVLNRNGRLDRIDGTSELGQHVVAWGIDDPAMVLLDETSYHLAISLERANGGLFIIAHEATVAFDIGAEDGGEFALHTSAFPR